MSEEEYIIGKIHYAIDRKVDTRFYNYLCNWTCAVTHAKITQNVKKVTCKNCLRKIKNGEHKKWEKMIK